MQLSSVFAFNALLVIVWSMGRHYKKAWRNQQAGIHRHRFWVGHFCRHFQMYVAFWITLGIVELFSAFIWIVLLGHRVN